MQLDHADSGFDRMISEHITLVEPTRALKVRLLRCLHCMSMSCSSSRSTSQSCGIITDWAEPRAPGAALYADRATLALPGAVARRDRR